MKDSVIARSMIDLHAHLLPGLDDGPPDMGAALAMAAAAEAAGTRVMAATPHIEFRFGVAPAELAGRVAELTGQIARAGITLEVVSGGELAPDRVLDMSDAELAAIALGGSRCVLLECPFARAGDLMGRLVAHLQMKGFRVLLAHPERSPTFLADPDALADLVRRGAFVQLTAGSLRGDFGRAVRRGCQALLERRLVHVVASDAHDVAGRSPALGAVVRDALAELGQPPELLELLCEAGPRALLDDAALPELPAARVPRRRWFRG